MTLEQQISARNAALATRTLCHAQWKIDILCAMQAGPIRFGQLRRLLPGASKKGLSQRLKELQAAGIVNRNDMSGRMLHIEYELNESMRSSVISLLGHLSSWGAQYSDLRQAEVSKSSARDVRSY